MRASTDTYHRIILLACSSLCIAMVAMLASPRLETSPSLAALLPICSAGLLVSLVVVIIASRRFSVALRADQAAAVRSQSTLQVALDNMSQGLVLCSTKADVVAVNKRFLALFGIAAHRVRAGMPVADLIRLQAEAGNMPAVQVDALIQERMTRPPGSSGQVLMAFQQGEFQIAYQPRPEGGWACTFEDVTAKLDAQRRLAFMAHHDPLTGLPNRALLRERIEAALTCARPFTVMLIDLDHFKQANDTFGHVAGDGLLCAVAGRLQAALRDGDTLARLGGDEFAVVMNAPCTSRDADRQAGRMVRMLSEPFVIDGQRIGIGASVGITQAAPSDRGVALDIDRLLRQADHALYCAKKARNGFHRFQPSTEGRLAVA